MPNIDVDATLELAEILATATPMPLAQATDGVLTGADHVYVVPPNHEMTSSGGGCLGRAAMKISTVAIWQASTLASQSPLNWKIFW
jgi:chemotaxis response regulator CheB